MWRIRRQSVRLIAEPTSSEHEQCLVRRSGSRPLLENLCGSFPPFEPQVYFIANCTIHNRLLTYDTDLDSIVNVIRKPPRFVAVCIYISFCIFIFQLSMLIRSICPCLCCLMTAFNLVDRRLVLRPGFLTPAFDDTTYTFVLFSTILLIR